MTIHLPKDVERSITEAVRDGHFASVDEAMTEAAHLLLQALKPGQAEAQPPPAGHETTTVSHKPIWEVAEEIRKSIPAEEWARLPADGAEQLDHYLYGSPRRPTS
jgi:Arc/MetJ-type ribon-helix-helix transcriptional regulator